MGSINLMSNAKQTLKMRFFVNSDIIFYNINIRIDVKVRLQKVTLYIRVRKVKSRCEDQI